MAEKKLFWVGSSLEDLRRFPRGARCDAGHQLHRVQSGLEPVDWKPMQSVGPGVFEIRIHDDGEYRVFYIAKFSEGIYVLHAFRKKSQETRQSDIDLGKSRLRDVKLQRGGR